MHFCKKIWFYYCKQYRHWWYDALHLGLHCLPKYLFAGIQRIEKLLIHFSSGRLRQVMQATMRWCALKIISSTFAWVTPNTFAWLPEWNNLSESLSFSSCFWSICFWSFLLRWRLAAISCSWATSRLDFFNHTQTLKNKYNISDQRHKTIWTSPL